MMSLIVSHEWITGNDSESNSHAGAKVLMSL